MKQFRVVATDKAAEGMCLYEDVTDQAGNVLLPRQTILTGTLIGSLRRRDIDMVLIVDDSITDEQRACERVRVLERLGHLCRHSGNGRANTLLRRVVEQYRLATLS